MGMAKLKIGGAWSGVLEVELDEWTVTMLRTEVAKRSGLSGPETINVIYAGKLLKDGDGTEKLSQLGVKNNAKILTSIRVSPDQGKSLKEEFLAEEERCSRLSRLKGAAISLAKRHADGSLPVEDFNLELENQSGQKVQMGSETDQRAIIMGLMLHTNAKALIRRKNYKDALEVLTMGEEAFSLCNQKLIEMVDNVPILQIDMVWCYFMLRDISWISVAGVRLAKAREGLERSHGKEASRVRILQGGCYPELALHLRLDLLEGIVAYHSGQIEKSRQSLTSAQAKFSKLQIPDGALALLLDMGYKERDAMRALRMNNQDVQSAVDFLEEQKEKKARKREENIRRRDEILEQKRYGMTPLKKAVDLQRLNELVSIGFEKDLVGEALRRNENDTQKALDDLTNPETNASIQVFIESRKKKRLRQAENAAIEGLVSMGFPREAVIAAIRNCGTRQAALDHLLEASSNFDATINGTNASLHNQVENGNANPSLLNNQMEAGGPSNKEGEERDVEMEDEITGELLRGDAFSDYDIEVTEEGEAINEYLALITAVENVKNGSSS